MTTHTGGSLWKVTLTSMTDKDVSGIPLTRSYLIERRFDGRQVDEIMASCAAAGWLCVMTPERYTADFADIVARFTRELMVEL